VSVSVSTDKQGRHRIQYRFGGKVSSLRLGGKTPKKVVEAFANEFRVLLHHRECGLELPASTTKWLSDLTDERYAKLEKIGLVQRRRGKVLFISYLEEFFARRAANNDLAASTPAVWSRAIAKVKDFWKHDVPIDELKGQNFADFRGFLKKQKGKSGGCWAEATVNKTCGVLSQALNSAVLEGILDRNPVRGWVKTTAGANPENWEYIDSDTIRLLIASTSCREERLLIGLSRFAALRIPSEIKELTWSDLHEAPDGRCGILSVRTPKTSNSGKHFKEVPVRWELLSLLKEMKQASISEYMLPTLRGLVRPQSRIERLCVRAGVAKWKKISHNLRASCLTDWLRHYGVVEVSQWAGNSPKILLGHYCRPNQGTASLLAAARFLDDNDSPKPLALPQSDSPVATDMPPKAA
jgi:hypothetical protein